MEKQNYSQLELFSGSGNLDNPATNENGRKSFLLRIRPYEKALVIIIGFITISLFSFSLGVEKGKKIAASAVSLERASLPALPQPVVNIIEPKENIPTSNPVVYPDKPGVLVKKGREKTKGAKPGYTIQVASYKTNTFAQKEAELLKKRGFSPLFLTKGNYTVLCVGTFASRNTAEGVLFELKKQRRYVGCLIRRL